MFVLMTLMLAAAAQAQQPDCQQFHNGKFKQEVDGVFIGTITRKGNRQVEQYGNIKVFLEVRWLNECEYELRFNGGNKAYRKREAQKPPVAWVRARIIRTAPDGYYLEATIPGEKRDDAKDMHFVRVK